MPCRLTESGNERRAFCPFRAVDFAIRLPSIRISPAAAGDPKLIRPARDRTMAAAPDPQQRRLVAVAAGASSALTGPVLLGVLIDWLAGTFPWVSVAGVL